MEGWAGLSSVPRLSNGSRVQPLALLRLALSPGLWSHQPCTSQPLSLWFFVPWAFLTLPQVGQSSFSLPSCLPLFTQQLRVTANPRGEAVRTLPMDLLSCPLLCPFTLVCGMDPLMSATCSGGSETRRGSPPDPRARDRAGNLGLLA